MVQNKNLVVTDAKALENQISKIGHRAKRSTSVIKNNHQKSKRKQ